VDLGDLAGDLELGERVLDALGLLEHEVLVDLGDGLVRQLEQLGRRELVLAGGEADDPGDRLGARDRLVEVGRRR